MFDETERPLRFSGVGNWRPRMHMARFMGRRPELYIVFGAVWCCSPSVKWPPVDRYTRIILQPSATGHLGNRWLSEIGMKQTLSGKGGKIGESMVSEHIRWAVMIQIDSALQQSRAAPATAFSLLFKCRAGSGIGWAPSRPCAQYAPVGPPLH